MSHLLACPLPIHIIFSDEFAEVKAVKLLRRGRRLQQVESVCPSSIDTCTLTQFRAIYGKASDTDDAFSPHPSPRLPSVIPPLKVEFFSSPFWRWFSIQSTSPFAFFLLHHFILNKDLSWIQTNSPQGSSHIQRALTFSARKVESLLYFLSFGPRPSD